MKLTTLVALTGGAAAAGNDALRSDMKAFLARFKDVEKHLVNMEDTAPVPCTEEGKPDDCTNPCDASWVDPPVTSGCLANGVLVSECTDTLVAGCTDGNGNRVPAGKTIKDNSCTKEEKNNDGTVKTAAVEDDCFDTNKVWIPDGTLTCEPKANTPEAEKMLYLDNCIDPDGNYQATYTPSTGGSAVVWIIVAVVAVGGGVGGYFGYKKCKGDGDGGNEGGEKFAKTIFKTEIKKSDKKTIKESLV